MIRFLFLLPIFSFASIILQTKQIQFKEYPGAFNPSIHEMAPGQYLFIFRYMPDPVQNWFFSYIVAVLLNDQFEPITEPQILNELSKSEDPRIFSWRNRLFLIYNDDFDPTPTYSQKRCMAVAELFYENGLFSLSAPLPLNYPDRENHSPWQKNWIPFVWNHQLELIYSINPHEIISPNFFNGECCPFHTTQTSIEWPWGPLRGSTPPQIVNDQYLSFFHSSIVTVTPASNNQYLWHYFMGAYTFNPEPPFNITKISPEPIIAPGFYTASDYYKRVIFPGGYVVSGDKIYLAYGKDDREMWIATLDKNALLESLVKIR